MKNRNQNFVGTIVQLLLASLLLLVNLALLTKHSSAQNPKPETPAADEPCAECKELEGKLSDLDKKVVAIASDLKQSVDWYTRYRFYIRKYEHNLGAAVPADADPAKAKAKAKDWEEGLKSSQKAKDDTFKRIEQLRRDAQAVTDELYPTFNDYVACLKTCCRRNQACPKAVNPVPPASTQEKGGPTGQTVELCPEGRELDEVFFSVQER